MTDKKPKLEIRNLRKSFGALAATDDVNLTVYADEIHALIGPNGAGKTTLISQISGEIMPDSGQILLDGKDITRVPPHQRAAVGLARSFQISQLYLDFTVEDNVAMAVQAGTSKRFSLWRNARNDESLRKPARDALVKVGLDHRANDLVSSLAHGEKRQLELAIALSLNAPVLLLDEPMAGLGAEESMLMKDILQSLKGQYAMLLVEHDMDIVFALADRCTVLVYGHPIFTGTPDEVRDHPAVRDAYLGNE
ncbi:ABC transporter ATP-binding protein [Neopusillimonas aromaticivorans]|uniref:ABC transporter ATP-binding protein n=1 Tax=Neopusillimonas aromaticivorans TaxID=2979868 RepID=UPI0025952EE3|nr:ABC transporter ATP-binding protein [Neopusillimonas aromaticivorans]NLZ10170.1 ABC transporter ATP-binding protein [Alcaligenaceae bacterium]WJJ94824.1 ABC transporter ATP-binding protein [Neopusillimonas aromaticivorans]